MFNGFWYSLSLRERCPDCDLRNALNPVGFPLVRNGVPLTAGCEGCDGRGWIRVKKQSA